MATTDNIWESDDDEQLDDVRHSRLKGALSYRSKEVGKYHLGKVLGKGSCAVVRLGTHKETGHLAAIKIMKPKTLREQKEALREVEALQRLNHPNITRLHQVVRDNGYTCLILELGAGGELFDYVMNSGKVPEDEARFMFRQVLSAVQYCHANLVAHRDIKPENLLLDENGNIKLSDFGLSNVLKPGRLFSTWCGSPVYTPPEVVLRQQYSGVSMDIWSLGVVLYVMVTGGMPWRLESNVVKNIEDLIEGTYEIPDFLGVSEDCKDLIGLMLVADSSQRASLETIMNHKWTCEGYGAAPVTHLEPKPLVDQVNEGIFMQLEGFGYDLEKARIDIKTDPESPALTAYRLLLSKHRRAQNVKNCKPGDADLVNSPSQFLDNVTRIRSRTHPTPVPKSPLALRKENSCRNVVEPDGADIVITSDVKKGKEKGFLRSFFDKFRKSSPSPNSSSPSNRYNSRNTPRPITMVVAHNSPSPLTRRRDY